VLVESVTKKRVNIQTYCINIQLMYSFIAVISELTTLASISFFG
jgi:hypothetical protein